MRGISALRFLPGPCKPCGNLLLFFLFSFFLEIKFVDGRKKTRKGRTRIICQIDRQGGKENCRVAANATNLGFIFGFFGGFDSALDGRPPVA